ncbi:MAG: DMT family transporter [Candidatus Cloacimonetes bacterium]|nr:DMT family transporter [Candidatus Cloacimonadota bacterium]
MRNKLMIYGAALSATLFWGASFVWYKEAFLAFDAISIIFFRLIIAAMLMLAASKLIYKKEKIKVEDYKFFLLLSFLQPFCYFIFESYGMKFISSTLGALIIATIPLFTPIFTYFLAKEKITLYHISGLVISFLGVFIVLTNDFIGRISALGISLLLLAVISANFYGIMVKKLLTKYSGFTIVKTQNIIGLFYLLPLFLIFERNKLSTLQITDFISIFKLAVFGSVLAFIFKTYVIKKIGLINSNIFANMIPVYTAIIAYFTLHEVLGMRKFIGMVIVISGLFISQIPQFMRKRIKARNFQSS